MSTLRDYSSLGQAKFLASGTPGASVIGAFLDDIYCDTDTGTLWTCVRAEFGEQLWMNDQGLTTDIAAYNNADLFAAYDMDDISGTTLNDKSPNGRNMTITGALQTTGVFGSALDFDSASEILTSGSLSSSGQAQAFCFFVQTSASGVQIIYESSADTSANAGSITVYLDSNNSPAVDYSRAGVVVQSATLSTPQAVNDGSPHFITVSLDGADTSASQVAISVDGADAGAISYSVARQAHTNTARTYYIGARTGGTSPLTGFLDQFRILLKVPSATEIAQLYNNGAGI